MKTFFAMVLGCMLLLVSPSNAGGPLEPVLSKSIKERLVKVYEIRVEAARNDLEYDKAVARIRRQDYEMYRNLAMSNAETRENFRKAAVAYDQARLNVAASEIALKEAIVIHEIIREGTEKDYFKPDDIKYMLSERLRTKVR